MEYCIKIIWIMLKGEWTKRDILKKIKGVEKKNGALDERADGVIMWQNIAGLGIILSLISIIFGYFMVRLDRLQTIIDRKVDETMCMQKYQEVQKDFKRGEKIFDVITEQLKAQGDLLIEINTKIKLILDQKHDRER